MFGWFQRLIGAPSRPETPALPTVSLAPPEKPAAPAAAREDGWMQRSVADYEFTSWLFASENHPDLFTNPCEDAILAAIDEAVKSPRSGTHLVRRIPGVIPQLLQSLRSPDFSGQELARLIWHDVVLVSEVLRLANSAAYNPGTPITSIDHAILILGQDGLRQLITGVAFKPIIDMKSGSFTRRVAPHLWDQAERCALANRILARAAGADPLEAFLAGLIHNVGLIVALRIIDQIYDRSQPLGSPTFCNALVPLGRALTANIAREWHFPDTVIRAVGEADAAEKGGGAGSREPMSALGAILVTGDYLAKLDTLRRQGRIAQDDPRVSHDLSEAQRECFAQIALLEQRDWGLA